jgi:hypothetical protein
VVRQGDATSTIPKETAMKTCPACGYDRFRVGRAIRVWQTLDIICHDDGSYQVEYDNLHDTLEEKPFEEATCCHCDRTVPITHLFPDETQTESRPFLAGAAQLRTGACDQTPAQGTI